jgi:putative membrane protein
VTTTETPPPAPPEPPEPVPHHRRSGFYLAPWVLMVLGGLVLLAVGFVIGRAVDHGDRARPFFRNGGGGRGIGLLFVLIVLALIVTGIVLLVRHYTAPRHDVAPTAPLASATPTQSAEQVLADRFARGEIDEAEFVSRRNTLRS